MPLNWQDVVQGPNFTDVMRLVHLAMRLTSVEQEAYRAELVRTRRSAYEAALTELAKEAGCDRSALIGEGQTLTELNEQSRLDAESIVNTYNLELTAAIIKIKEDNPRANRNTYAKRLLEWDTNRATWKDPQIATNTTLSARQSAQRDFFEFNSLVEGTVELLGQNPAAEPVCQEALDMGRVDVAVAMGIKMPSHVNCAHTWGNFKIKNLDKGDCLDLWMG